ncbi:MAG: branched-chain amino acid ABC transporter substrate-binding protein [Actinomycetota bacterium]|nr:branched-chain amino acid ABC transporter substrate-binding protein [Actinomycetota bacterium]
MALGLTACGDDDDEGGGAGGGGAKATGNTLTVYSSLPRQGASRVQALAIEDGAKLALKQAGSKVGKYQIKYVPLDDSTAAAGKWDAGPTSANARRASQDKSTIAYIGEYNSGASAISIPILNEAGIPQVSPANTAVGLTKKEPGTEPGEPDKYYPTRKRHYVRVVPRDTIQGAALASLMQDEGCKSAYIVNDKEVYGAGLSRNIENAAKRLNLQVLGNDGFDPKAANYRSLASRIAAKNPDCIADSQVVETNGVQVAKDLAAGIRDAKFFGPDGLAISSFANAEEGGIPAKDAPRWTLTVATLSPENYPPSGRRFFADFKREYNVKKNPDPYAIYGYESMSLVLDAIKRAGAQGNDREAVRKQLFNTKGRKSVLGTYSIDSTGDSSITDYGAYKIKNGELSFFKTVKAKP